MLTESLLLMLRDECVLQHDSCQHSMARLCALLCDTASFIAYKRCVWFSYL